MNQDRQQFKQRLKLYLLAKELNPLLKYYDFIAELRTIKTYEDGGIKGFYSNHTGTPTMYLPVTREYEINSEGIGEIQNVHMPEVVITPLNNINLVEAVDKGRRNAAPYVGAIVAGAALPAIASTGGLGTVMDLTGIITDPLDPTNYLGLGAIKGFKTLQNKSSKALDYHLARLFNNNENNIGTGLDLANNRTGKNLTKSDVINKSLFINSLNPKLIKDYYNAARKIGINKFDSTIFAPLAYIRSNYIDPYFAVNGNIYKNPLANFTSKGRRYRKDTGNRITDMDESVILSHELDHVVNTPSQAGKESVLEWFKGDSSDGYFLRNNSTELSARGTLIKDWLKMSRNRDITVDELKNAAENYVKDAGIDNNMTEMFDRIFDWKKAAKWFSLYASMMTMPIVLDNKIELFVDGGDTNDKENIRLTLGEPDYTLPIASKPINPYTGKPFAPGNITTLLDPMNILDFTPVGDIIAAKELTDALIDKDWSGAGLSALGFLPFVPSGLRKVNKSMKFNTKVNKQLVSDAIDALDKLTARRKEIADAIIDKREEIANTVGDTEAMRRAKAIDNEYGTNYSDAYNAYIKEQQNVSLTKDPSLIKFDTPDKPSFMAFVTPGKSGSTIVLNKNMINSVDDLRKELITHEIGHYIDYLAGDKVVNNDFLRRLSKRSKFKPINSETQKFRKIDQDTYDYILLGTEMKSHMNQFRDYLKNKGYSPNKVKLKTIERELDKAPDFFNGTKLLFDLYKDPKQFRKDFNSIPVVDTGINNDDRYFA